MKKETVDEIVGRALRGEPYVPTGGGDDAPAQPAPATQQAGWKLVPMVPTAAMVDAGCPVGEMVDHFDMATTYRSMLAASPTAQAEGWRLVPEDATEEMVRATDKVNFANADTDGTMHNVWNVMLAAAPTSAEGVEHGPQ